MTVEGWSLDRLTHTRKEPSVSTTQQHSEIPVGEPYKLCGAPAGMTCSEYAYLQHVSKAHDRIYSSFTSPEELTAEDRMDRIGVPEVSA